MLIPSHRRPFLQSFVAVCYDCASDRAQTRNGVRQITEQLVAAGNFNVVARKVFQQHGRITAAYTLAESHCFIEAYPDRNIVLVDILACTRFNKRAVRQSLVTMVKPRRIIVRGKRF